jgi:predicted RNA binding protein YcfA (HicA-like mRNA interferase family)
MSGKLPALTGAEVIRALERAGFAVVRTRSSHQFLQHPDGRMTVVPVHSGETIGPGLMSKILRDCGLEREQFRALIKKKKGSS